MRYADISNVKELRNGLVLRNSYISDTLKAARPMHKCVTDPSVGHVKLLFSSRRSREQALARDRFAWGKSMMQWRLYGIVRSSVVLNANVMAIWQKTVRGKTSLWSLRSYT